ncbi:MAG: peroxide stress protein YaaA [Lachnospiraceae bacterium]|nr:peroxide stress protein YaaA [Lachnospiraceae bacterium]
MKIIISPAKKMNICDDSIPWKDMPCFLESSGEILQNLRSKSYPELKELWCCNEQIAKLNYDRVQHMDLKGRLSPALLSYEGLQYQYMYPAVFTKDQWDYVQKHLRILSGFYGILKPLDGIVPYRLEMQAKLSIAKAENLYRYWDSRLYEALFNQKEKESRQETQEQSRSVIINLASKEYSKAIEPYLEENIRYITCIFGTLTKEGKVKVKATEAKMARGEMVRFLAERHAKVPEVMKEFTGQGFSYDETRSCKNQWVFIK